MGLPAVCVVAAAVLLAGCATSGAEAPVAAATSVTSPEAPSEQETFELEVPTTEPSPQGDVVTEPLSAEAAMWTQPGWGCLDKDCEKLEEAIAGGTVRDGWQELCADGVGLAYCDLAELGAMCQYADPSRPLIDCSLEMYWEFGTDVIAFIETADRFQYEDPADLDNPNAWEVVMDGCETDGRTGSVWGRIVNGGTLPHSYRINVIYRWARPGFTPMMGGSATVETPLIQPGSTYDWSGWLRGSGIDFSNEPARSPVCVWGAVPVTVTR